jgi:outer membrane receptor for ferrienterochelin and colicin
VATREEVEALSPGRIEKIEVSKGEQSVAKYGAKAKNGIVEITTKKRE